MRPTPMIGRTVLVALTGLTLGVLLLAACGGDDDGQRPPGRLTDPRSVPTATPWAQPPEPIMLGPDILTPISQEEDEADGEEGEDGQATAGECGETYTVQAGDAPYSIGEKCGVDWEELLEINGIDDPTSLRVGQVLELPP
jgi:LysM repeat protein